MYRSGCAPRGQALRGRNFRVYLVPAALVAIGAYYYVWVFHSGDVFHTHSANAANRGALVRLHEAIHIGASHAQVLQQYWSHQTDELRLHVDNPARWIVSMPGEFGASDWTLIVEFRDGKASAVRVRTADGPAPIEGPRDKGGPAAT